MKKTLFLYTIFVILSLFSCTSNNDDDFLPVNDNQLILFQFEYVNAAWSYQHSGWFINNNGEVKEYNLPNDWIWNDDTNLISSNDLEFNYLQADLTINQLDLDELNEKKALINATLNGTITTLECPGSDVGAFTMYAYYYDSSIQMYRRQLLNLTGDCKQHNTISEAIVLTEWLSNL